MRRLADAERTPRAVTGPRSHPDDPFLIMYTSGTTANPKGCVLTSGALVLNALAIVDRLEIPGDDVWWDPLPMFHMGGIMLDVLGVRRRRSRSSARPTSRPSRRSN